MSPGRDVEDVEEVSKMNPGVWQLKPSNGRKSFGYKCWCRVLDDGKRAVLVSCETIVATIKNGKLARHWYGWTQTTNTYVESFCDFCGVPYGKSDWSALPVDPVPSWAS